MSGAHRLRVAAGEHEPGTARDVNLDDDDRRGARPSARGVRAVWRRRRWGLNRVVPCRDIRGAAARLIVHRGSIGVVLSSSAAGPVQLTSRQARRLQKALRLAGPDDGWDASRARLSGAGR